MKTVFWIVLVLGGSYWGFLKYPGVLFKHSVEHKGFVLMSANPVDKPGFEYLDKAIERLETSPLYSPSRKFKVYLAGPGFLYSMMTPFCGDGLGCSYSLMDDRVVLPVADIASAGTPVLVRQAIYDLVQEKKTPVKYHFLKAWKLEGYAESVGGESVGYAASAVCGNDDVPEDFRERLEKKLVVEILMSDDKINFMALLDANYAYDHAKARMMLRHCGK
ncbi:MAG: hypothetical protein FD189_2427 [Elusimicrobia bacterium]|nr:MAG: hypothetical protein FD154_2304 [Elusimicrobiota bacterium]KAF0152921.1 MAG: hypothetical protein FD189_2427 [Elusimicrobiota bacterium]